MVVGTFCHIPGSVFRLSMILLGFVFKRTILRGDFGCEIFDRSSSLVRRKAKRLWNEESLKISAQAQDIQIYEDAPYLI